MNDLITGFKGINPKPVAEITWLKALDNIKSGKYKKAIDSVRNLVEKHGTKSEEYKKAKCNLPGVTFGGTFSHRANAKILSPTGFIIPDMDDIPQQTESLFNLLVQDTNVWFVFRSPSGEGLKVGIRAQNILNDEDHKKLYFSVERYFKELYGIEIDVACKDISRLTFVSNDPDLWVNHGPQFFDIQKWKSEESPIPEQPIWIPSGSTTGKEKYALKVLEGCCQRILGSQPKQKHHTRLKESRLIGGYLQWLNEGDVLSAFEQAITASGTPNVAQAMKTVRNGIEYGRVFPLEIEDKYYDNRYDDQRKVSVSDDISGDRGDNNDKRVTEVTGRGQRGDKEVTRGDKRVTEVTATETVGTQNLANDIHAFLRASKGSFTVDFLDRELGLTSRLHKRRRSNILNKYINKEYKTKTDIILKKDPRKANLYHLIPTEMDWIDLEAPTEENFPIKLPFDLDKKISIPPKSIIIVAGTTNSAKALANETPVLTPTGWVEIQHLKTGDRVFGKDGEQTTVLGVYPQGERECYRFFFYDRTWIDSDREHIWTLQTEYQMYCPTTGRGNINKSYGCWIDMTTNEIVKKYGLGKIKQKYPKIPSCSAINFPEKPTTIDPYLLGVLLGDGSISSGTPKISTADDEILSAFKDHGYKLKYDIGYDYKIKTKTENMKVKGCMRSTKFGTCFIPPHVNHLKKPKEYLRLKTQLKKLGLWGTKSDNKFVPTNYLFNTSKVRLEILKGLMDTDGFISKDGGSITFSSVSKQLAKDVQFLIRSLGGKVTCTKNNSFFKYKGIRKQGQDYYRLYIKANGLKLFKLKRKLEKYKPYKYSDEKRIIRIEKIGKKETTCIQTDAKDQLFIAKDFIVTHNTALILNTLRLNLKSSFEKLLLMSEGAGEIKGRIKYFGDPAKLWKDNVMIASQSDNFDTAIETYNTDGLTCIDYLEPTDGQYYLLTSQIRNIYDCLKTGVAMVALQKHSQSTMGRGGEGTAEKARLYMTVDYLCSGDRSIVCALALTKVKQSLDKNMQGKELHFRLEHGSKLTPLTDWMFSSRVNRERCAREYENEDADKSYKKVEEGDFVFRTENGDKKIKKVRISRKQAEEWAENMPNIDVFKRLEQIADDSFKRLFLNKGYIWQITGILDKENMKASQKEMMGESG